MMNGMGFGMPNQFQMQDMQAKRFQEGMDLRIAALRSHNRHGIGARETDGTESSGPPHGLLGQSHQVQTCWVGEVQKSDMEAT